MVSRRRAAAVAALAGACWAGGAAHAAPQAADPRLALSPHPTAVIWSGDGPGALCAMGRTLQVSAGPLARRHGGFHRNAELVAEILAPGPAAARVTRAAQACADQASALSGGLWGSAGGAPLFGDNLRACLSRSGAAPFVGRLTLWVESGCDL